MAWNLLFTSDIGLLSLFTILFILVMAVYIGVYAAKQANKDGSNASAKPHQGAH